MLQATNQKLLLYFLFIAFSLFVVNASAQLDGKQLEDRTDDPKMSPGSLQVVANLKLPPGNIAVSADGRVFFSFHPAAQPATKVAELVNGKAVPFPNKDFQSFRLFEPYFKTVLSMRIDRKGRLWTLDYGKYGLRKARLFAFDVNTRKLIHRYVFPERIAGLGSMLNDFQVDLAGKKIYIADTSPVADCSSLQDVFFKPKDEIIANGPYQIFRFKPGVKGIPGH